jgi:hypothetical protein
MCAAINSGAAQTQDALFCLQCRKLVLLLPDFVFEVSDNAGVFLGYLHKNCFDEWERNNPSSVVAPLTNT